MAISEERFNFVMARKQALSNQVFATLELLSRCSPYVTEDVRAEIIAAYEEFSKHETNVDWERNGDTLIIRRIQ